MTNLTTYVQNTLPYMMCPNASDLYLRGTHALDQTPMQTNSTQFELLIYSCPRMNEIRQEYLGEDPIPCASDSSINQVRKSLKILVGVMHETFDAWEYN